MGTSATKKQLNIYEKLSNIQIELKAKKSQYNNFGKYYYRSCEDILEAVKPLCNKNRTTLIIGDEVTLIGDRTYIQAICRLNDWDSDMAIISKAFAREDISKKGMDLSQLTGSTSTYARKYALNGMFNIDDSKDSDDPIIETEAKEKAKNYNQKTEENKKTQRPKTVKGLDGKMKPIITEETFKKIVSEVKKDEAGLKEIVNATRQGRKVSEITEEEGKCLLDLIATTKKQRNVEDEKLEF